MKNFKHFLSTGVFTLFIFLAFGSMDDGKKDDYSSDISITSENISGRQMSPEKTEILEKLKEKAKKDWPMDYVTQKFWYDEQIQAKQRLK